MSKITHKITTFLWFEKEAGEAANFYTSLFPDSKMLSQESHTGTPSGSIEIYTIELAGQEFSLMSAGPEFKINEAISFIINCVDQEEVDYYWDRLTANGGEESMCGWLKDRFGVSWQVIPVRLNELLQDSDKEKADRVLQAMLKMKKLNVAEFEKAYNG